MACHWQGVLLSFLLFFLSFFFFHARSTSTCRDRERNRNEVGLRPRGPRQKLKKELGEHKI